MRIREFLHTICTVYLGLVERAGRLAQAHRLELRAKGMVKLVFYVLGNVSNKVRTECPIWRRKFIFLLLLPRRCQAQTETAYSGSITAALRDECA